MSDHLDLASAEGRLFDAARKGDVSALAGLLDDDPARLEARDKPHAWSLLHHAAQHGHLPVVNLLLERGLSPNTLESGDNTSPMHWAAAAGHLEVVRQLADAGGDVIGHGDDHELEVIGWATCWYGCDDDAHRAVAEFLVSRGARHHIFSAIAMNLADEVRHIVASDPGALTRRMSRNEDHQLPLHFAVRMNRPTMVALLVKLGADPLGVDHSGNTAAVYATSPGIDRPVMVAIRAMTRAELQSAERGHRTPNAHAADLLALLTLGDWEAATQLTRENPRLIGDGGVLHLMAKRGDPAAVKWLLDHGADPNARWAHWDAVVTPLHLAAWGGSAEAIRLLLAGGADPTTRDSKHGGDAMGWAEHFERPEIMAILEAHRGPADSERKPDTA